MRSYFLFTVALIVGQCSLFTGCQKQDPKRSEEGKENEPSVSRVDSTAKPQLAKTREFYFTYSGKVASAKKGQTVRIWVPIAPETSDQKVEILESSFPEKVVEKTESKFGNKMYFTEIKAESAKEIPFLVKYKITRKEVQGLVSGKLTPENSFDSDSPFLKPNRLVPTSGKPIELYEEFVSSDKKENRDKSVVNQAEGFYDFVFDHMKYDKTKAGYGKGDVLWACDSKTGNCTDFHSLFISVARNRKIPAKFQIGFPIPAKRGSGKIGGYHCWARFHSEKNGWIPVDISEADKDPTKKDYFFGNLNENRVLFSTGRDIELEPKNQSGPVNYFVYPVVEIDGKPVSKNDLGMEFRYEDIKSSNK